MPIDGVYIPPPGYMQFEILDTEHNRAAEDASGQRLPWYVWADPAPWVGSAAAIPAKCQCVVRHKVDPASMDEFWIESAKLFTGLQNPDFFVCACIGEFIE